MLTLNFQNIYHYSMEEKDIIQEESSILTLLKAMKKGQYSYNNHDDIRHILALIIPTNNNE